MHKNSRLLFEKYARAYFRPDQRVLEIGPDRAPSTYRSIVGETAAWDTLDFASRTDVPLTYRTTEEYAFPVADSSYDVVFAAQVIEHVRKVVSIDQSPIGRNSRSNPATYVGFYDAIRDLCL